MRVIKKKKKKNCRSGFEVGVQGSGQGLDWYTAMTFLLFESVRASLAARRSAGRDSSFEFWVQGSGVEEGSYLRLIDFCIAEL